jgi:hypothetical protein
MPPGVPEVSKNPEDQTEDHFGSVGALRFGPNWIKFDKPSENRVYLTIFVQFWWFLTVLSIFAES